MFYKTNDDEIVFDEEYHVFERLEDYEENNLWNLHIKIFFTH